MKTCIDCAVQKPTEDFYFANKNHTSLYSRCKKCHNKKRPQWPNRYQTDKHAEYRNKILDLLGGRCAYCGYDENLLGLDIDHINNDGRLERKNRKGTNATMLKRWLENGCVGLQLLCGTCHNIKSRTVSNKVSTQPS